MPNDNVSLDDYEFPGGAIPVASADYFETDIPWVEPGEYLNRSRTIDVRPLTDEEKEKTPDKIKLVVDYGENGLVPAQGDPVRFGPRHYIDTVLREVTYGGVGEVSGIGKYLAAFPTVADPTTASTLDGPALKAALKASTSLPVIVVIELEDDYRERPENAKPIRTKAFKQADGTYAKVITVKDKETGTERKVAARPRIARYKVVQ